MHIEINRSTVTLPRDALLTVRDGAGTLIICRSGALWITQEGDIRDAIVEPAASFTIRKAGATVITALRTSSLTLIGSQAVEVEANPQQRRMPDTAVVSVACN